MDELFTTGEVTGTHSFLVSAFPKTQKLEIQHRLWVAPLEEKVFRPMKHSKICADDFEEPVVTALVRLPDCKKLKFIPLLASFCI